MGSFKTQSARLAGDTGVLTEGLAEGESITYWKVLPHSAMGKISKAGVTMGTDNRGRMTGAMFDPAAAVLERLKLGIQHWDITDEQGNRVPWDPNNAAELLDGLPIAVTSQLSALIGGGDPEPDLDEELEASSEGPPETVGEDFAGNSEPSSEEMLQPPAGSKTSH